MPAGYEIARTPVPASATVVLAALGSGGTRPAGHAAPAVPRDRAHARLRAGRDWARRRAGRARSRRRCGSSWTAPVHRCATCTSSTSCCGCRWRSGIAHLLGILLRVRFTVAACLRRLRRAPGVAVDRGHGRGRPRARDPGASPAVWRPRAGSPPCRTTGARRPPGSTSAPDDGPGAGDPGRALPPLHLGRHPRRDHPAAADRPGGRAQRRSRSAPPTTVRMMDAIESALATGDGSPGLADYLARAGVSYLLVRNDLDYGRSVTTATVLVQQALARSPGLEPVATFGPEIRSSTVDGAPRRARHVGPGPADPAGRPAGRPRRGLPGAAGPDRRGWTGVVAVAGRGGAAAGRPRPCSPATAPQARARARARCSSRTACGCGTAPIGSGRDASSATLTRGRRGPSPTTSCPHMGSTVDDVGRLSGRRRTLLASSSWADTNPAGDSRPEHQPFAALDGDPTTSWRPQIETGPGQWLEVTLAQAQPVPEVTVHFDESAGGTPTQVTLDTGARARHARRHGTHHTVPARRPTGPAGAAHRGGFRADGQGRQLRYHRGRDPGPHRGTHTPRTLASRADRARHGAAHRRRGHPGLLLPPC